ncbi:MAG: M20 family metallopeptidase [Cytophagales bacterium]|nr:M20 family metallopeptidase [Cytophagales bacterium]
MSSLIDQIKNLSATYFEEILAIRRHLHANPELSFEEYNTANFIESKLTEFGFEGVRRVAETGVTFTLEGGSPGKTIALRADIDALPIVEQNEVSYKSTNEGVMHACGHDVHTASLLGVAKILGELKSEMRGSIRFIFQPGEEKVPGGASILIKEGILKNPVPNTILGQHVMPLLPAGKIGFRSGMYMASADEIYFTVNGKGGHGAMPESGVDPIVITSHIIVALQQIVSRKASPKIPSVLSFGDIHGHGATNVIPDYVKVKGTFRTYDEEWRARAHELMTKMATGMAESMGATCDFEIRKGYPFLVNEPVYTERTRKAAEAYMGESNVVDLDLWLAAEDFAYYSQEVDACFYRLGTANEEKGITSGVHTPTFNIEESALKDGMGLMAWLALQELLD